MNIDFIKGLVYGGIAVALIGYILERMSKAGGTAKLKDKRLDKFPDADQINLTPAKIVRKSIWARVVWFLWLIILVVTIILMVLIALQMQRPVTI